LIITDDFCGHNILSYNCTVETLRRGHTVDMDAWSSDTWRVCVLS